MKILLTCFEPFGGEKINASEEVLKLIDNNFYNNEILKIKLPTVFNKSISVLEEYIKLHNPDIVICLGQAAGRSNITIERVAINLNDANISDNEKNFPKDETIFSDGDIAYFSNLPIKSIVNKLKENSISASISNSAGTFVCNNLMYGLLYMIQKYFPNIKGGFIHIPILPIQAINKSNTPSMDLNLIKKAIEYSIICVS